MSYSPGFCCTTHLAARAAAAGKHVAGVGPVGDLDPLSHADEVDGVLADDVAAADGLHADLFLGPLAADPFAVEVGHFVVVAPEGLGHHLTHADRGAGGGVLLQFVVRFDDLHVEIVAEDLCHIREDLEADVDADRHVGGQHDRDRRGPVPRPAPAPPG